MNRISIICLGVYDMEKSLAFYKALGFETREKEDNPPVVFFSTPGTKLELFPMERLAQDINPENPPKPGGGFPGITLAYNVQMREEVDTILLQARNAGAAVLKVPAATFWGGYHAYFADPDGYCWELAWGPDFQYDEQGLLIM
jgi:catechol 2,3-dioxygenase-like lactoylglutathione lyase family enzyme